MYVVWVEFHVAEKHQAEFVELVSENARLSLEEPECHQFDVCVDPEQPTRIALYEIYTDSDAFQYHLDTPHFNQFNQTVTHWVQSKSLSIYERVTP